MPVQFNMGYILVASMFAGLFVAYVFYWLLSSTRRHIPSLQPVESQHTEPISGSDSEEQADEDQDKKPKKKIGVKKAAKLEAKAEKKAAREAFMREREERKLEQEHLEKLRQEEEERIKKQEAEQEEKERLEREEQARKEHEAYLQLAASFEVEEEGFDPDQETNSEDKLAHFIDYVKEQKVVKLEDLAAHFKMRTKDVLDRLQQLMANDTIIGIIDDRGKFISITEAELESVAKFIRQRGRVTVDELVLNSNKLIALTS